jgi:hypothetical protein
VTGEAIHGPLKGRRLKSVIHDEISFEIWRQERPMGRVLKPDPKFEAEYEDWNWEKQMRRVRTVRPKGKDDPLEPRVMVIGVNLGQAARAYPFPLLRRQSPVVDRLGGTPLLLLVGDDKKSIRVFKAEAGGRALTFARVAGVRPLRLVDAETASDWDFTGRAVAGPLQGTQLDKVYALKEYWFDWKTYNPGTGVYVAGALPSDLVVPKLRKKGATDEPPSPAPAAP